MDTWILRIVVFSGLFAFTSTLLAQDDFEAFKREQEEALQDMAKEFAEYKEEVTREYEAYVQQEQAAFEEFKRKVEEKWQEFKGSTKKTWVDYDKDLDSRVEADFEKGEVTVEVIVEENEDSPELVQERIAKQVKAAIEAPAGDGKPVLENQLPAVSGIEIRPGTTAEVSKAMSKQAKPTSKPYKAKDGKKRQKYSVVLKMVPDHLQRRVERFALMVQIQAQRFGVDFAIAMAIVETESSFNPMARSPVPAYGLMQLVPQTGARDAYRYVYKNDELLKSDYLYKPENNIELGVAYLSLIRREYFGRIRQDKKAYLCMIAAYNTGIGNVAKALTGTMKLSLASEKASALSEDELKRVLIKNLPYQETRDYLEKVIKRAPKYRL